MTTPDSKYNTFGQRFLAGLVDGLILFPFGIVDYFVFSQQIVWLTVAWIPVSYSVYWLYSVISHGLYGKTVGKHLAKVIVLDNESEGRITWRQAILRDAFLIIVNVLAAALDIYVIASGLTELPLGLQVVSIVLGYGSLIWFVVEIVTCLTNLKRRALHDFIAGTVVVSTEEVSK